MYRFQSFAILAGIIGLFATIAYAIFGWVGVILILAGSLIFNLLTIGGFARLILSFHRAREIPYWEAPDLHHRYGKRPTLVTNTSSHQ